MKKKMLLPMMCLALLATLVAPVVRAQEDAAPKNEVKKEAPAANAPAAQAPASAEIIDTTPASKGGSQTWKIIFGAGTAATIVWLSLFASMGFYIYLVIDSSILVRASKIMPQSLINAVSAAMKEGDVVKALQCCSKEPGPMANILSAGFSHVEEGFEVIQEAIATAADLETERIMQKLTWFSVNGNIAPMLGLLGTVLGMIMAFSQIGGGSIDIGALGVTIGFSLWTTAAGLFSAIPCVATYYVFRNNANRIILRMEAITMELIKDLRNVEVVTE